MAKRTGGIALHWKIFIGLALGLTAGLLANTLWDGDAWARVGVDHPPAYLAGAAAQVADLPAGVEQVSELDPENADLEGRAVWELTPDQARQYGLELREANLEAGAAAWAARFVRKLTVFVGDLFLRLLKFIAVPIVLFSLIVGASSLNDLKKLSRIGGKTVMIFMFTTAMAVTVGLVLANIVRPGSFISQDVRDTMAARRAGDVAGRIEAAVAPDVWQTILNIVPENPFEALATADMLPVVFTALMIGIALTLIPQEKARPVIAFCDGMTDVVIKLVHIVMFMAPYAVFALIAKAITDLGPEILTGLAVYSATVVAGLAVMLFGVYPSLLLAFAKVGPGRFFRAMAPAQLLAFSSSSSNATLPVTMQCLERRLGVSEDVTSFVAPLGATVNMDGTALYQGVAAVFIAQLYGMGLGIGEQLTIVLTATLASIGTAGVPGVGMIMLVIVLQSIGMDLATMTGGIAIIFAVDRILDMCRTTANISGDAMTATVVAATEGELATEEEVRLRREGRLLDEQPAEPVLDDYDTARQ